MASVLKVDSITGVTSAGDITITGEGTATMKLQSGVVKAYAHGSNSAALPSSFNIASGTDNGTGDYTYAFTNNMSSLNYTITTSCHSAGLAATNRDSQAAGSYKVQVFQRGNNTLGSASDQVNYSAVNGDLA